MFTGLVRATFCSFIPSVVWHSGQSRDSLGRLSSGMAETGSMLPLLQRRYRARGQFYGHFRRPTWMEMLHDLPYVLDTRSC